MVSIARDSLAGIRIMSLKAYDELYERGYVSVDSTSSVIVRRARRPCRI
jgi:hypothetical protein